MYGPAFKIDSDQITKFVDLKMIRIYPFLICYNFHGEADKPSTVQKSKFAPPLTMCLDTSPVVNPKSTSTELLTMRTSHRSCFLSFTVCFLPGSKMSNLHHMNHFYNHTEEEEGVWGKQESWIVNRYFYKLIHHVIKVELPLTPHITIGNLENFTALLSAATLNKPSPYRRR